VAPSGRLSHVGDINTGRCYRKTYKALVKNKGVEDIILPSILAMDKTHINMAGRLQMEPITISHGLLKHTVRRQGVTVRILGYFYHSAPAQLPALSELDTKFNAPSGLVAHGTVVVEAPLRRIKNVTWPTYLLNELHIQIQFILEESGFLQLQRKRFQWYLH
jgi:proteasome lid subunit RPN8/RPN11